MYRIGKEEVEAVKRVIESRSLFKINNGLRETAHCEEELRELFGVKYALLMTSGMAALASALTGLGIGPGDEVIVPAYTYIATAIAVVMVGAVPVVAEVDESLTLDPEDAARKLTPHTKAMIPVHIQGFPSKLDELKALAQKHGLVIVEDACQSDGGSYGEKRLGTHGAAGALSFNQYKIITSGEGGALLTDDRTIYERALIYHDSSAVAFFGDQLDGITEPLFCGSEFRTNEITAAILREQLKRMDGILSDLRRNKKYMLDALSGKYRFAPSNDLAGDCGTTLAFSFADEGEARAFAAKFGGTLPIDTGKHVYTHWTPILEKRGALNRALDPFNHPANLALGREYSADMCPRTLDILSRTVYHMINPDDNREALDAKLEKLLG